MTIPAEESQEKECNPSSDESKAGGSAENTLDQYLVTTSDLDDDDDDNLRNRDSKSLDARERKILNWQQSAFAVGCVNVAWSDDRYWFRPEESQVLERNPQVCCSAYVCGCLGARRVGNLAVLAQSVEEYDHVEIVNEETGEQQTTRRKRPKLLCVVGPYWAVNLCLTYPLIIGVSLLTAYRNFPDASIAVIVTWSLCTFLVLFSLAMVACRNPGVLYRQPQRPPDADDWRWNDQAKTYRPPLARFDPESQAVVEGFDHTCPWTGTAIGSRNMFWFRIFVTMVPICIAYSVVLNIFTI